LVIGFCLMLTVAFTYSLHVAGFLKRLYLS
jgi:hypothetical protein